MKKLGILKNLCPTLFNFRTDFFEFKLSFFAGLCWFCWLTFFRNYKSLHDSVFNPVQRNLPVDFLKTFIINIKNNTIFGIYNCSKFCPEAYAFFFCNSINGRQGKLKADLGIHLVYVLPALASTTGKGYLRIVENGGVEDGFVHCFDKSIKIAGQFAHCYKLNQELSVSLVIIIRDYLYSSRIGNNYINSAKSIHEPANRIIINIILFIFYPFLLSLLNTIISVKNNMKRCFSYFLFLICS